MLLVNKLYVALCTLGCTLAVALSGCAFTKPPEIKHYQTVAADPNRDTEAASQNHEKALKIIERASVEGNYQCACVAKTLCNVHKAEQLLHDALVADVRFGPAHNTLGLLYYHQRRLYLAAWEFQFASDLMPSRAEPLNNLGMVYEEARQLGPALDLYAMAVEIEPGNPVYLGNLARAHLRSGNDVEAIRGVLHQLLVQDTRPEWIGWAEDLLGTNPLSIQKSTLRDSPPAKSQAGAKAAISDSPVEELPLPLPAPLG